MLIQKAYQQLLSELYKLYDTREATNISDWVIESVTGLKRIDRILNKSFILNDIQQKMLDDCIAKLITHMPVQYVLHESWFAGMKLYVDENVLIPRPETDELVEWVLTTITNDQLHSFSIVDIGTGSGCIPIAIKKKTPLSKVSAIDISQNALNIAQQNAKSLQTTIQFFKADILNEDEWKAFPKYDIIISNPPYIRQSEQSSMKNNVLSFEPHTALFVPDNDVLIFYKAIANFGYLHLNMAGQLFFEVNENLGLQVCECLNNLGYKEIELKKDMHGKDRMVKGVFKNS